MQRSNHGGQVECQLPAGLRAGDGGRRNRMALLEAGDRSTSIRRGDLRRLSAQGCLADDGFAILDAFFPSLILALGAALFLHALAVALCLLSLTLHDGWLWFAQS